MQYANHPLDHVYSERGMSAKPHPQYPPTGYQNQTDSRSQSQSMLQSGSGTRVSHSTEVVVNTKLVPSMQYATSLSNQSNPEAASEPRPLTSPEYAGGDPGVRESPPGASSPNGGTPKITPVVRTSKVSYLPYNPLASSASENTLSMGGHAGGPNIHPHQHPPQDGMETHSDTNLLNYSPYTNVGVASGRVQVGGQKGSPRPPKAGVRGSIRTWENRGTKIEADHVEGSGLPHRVLHLPISTSKERGRGGMAEGRGRGEGTLSNGFEGGGKGMYGEL